MAPVARAISRAIDSSSSTSLWLSHADWAARRAQHVEDARAEALTLAQTRVPALLSYQPATIDADLERAIEQTTGPFRADYSNVLEEV